MKRGRVYFNGAIHQVTPGRDGGVRLADGTTLAEEQAHWLPPVQPGTIFALGLNYADHARELAFKAPEQPLVFLKGPNALVGHRARTPRPSGAEYMHYECELAVVIGKQARNVPQQDAYQYVAGYTVANKIAPYGERLNAGDVVLGGSFTRPVKGSRGDTFHADYGKLGQISFRFV